MFSKDFLEELKAASADAASKIADLIRDSAPVDSGALRESIMPAHPDDPDLAVEDDEIEATSASFNHAIHKMLRKLKEKVK